MTTTRASLSVVIPVFNEEPNVPALAQKLHAALSGKGDNVNTRYYWGAGHGANEDAEEFMAWIKNITGYTK